MEKILRQLDPETFLSFNKEPMKPSKKHESRKNRKAEKRVIQMHIIVIVIDHKVL